MMRLLRRILRREPRTVLLTWRHPDPVLCPKFGCKEGCYDDRRTNE